MQCVAACCSVLQRVAACCRVLPCVAACCSALQRVAVCFSLLQCDTVRIECNLRRIAENSMKHVNDMSMTIDQQDLEHTKDLTVGKKAHIRDPYTRSILVSTHIKRDPKYPRHEGNAQMHSTSRYGVATIRRLLKMIGLFCRISSVL